MAVAKSRSKLWFALHGWMALPVWLFLLFICLTGTICTIDREILWLFDPSVRAANPDALPRKPLNDVIAAVERQIAGAHVNNIRFGEPFMALEVGLSTPDAPMATAWVNPFSGTVQSVVTGTTFPNFIRGLHGWLLLPWSNGTSIGWYAVCLMALPLMGSVVTGLVIYKRFWRAFTAPRLRRGNGARVFWGDFHRLAAVWGLWFMVTISLTGLWFLVEGVMYELNIPLAVEGPDIAAGEAPSRPAGAPLPRMDVDAAVARAVARNPGISPLMVGLPEHALGTAEIYSRSTFPLLMEVVWVHPYSGAVVGWRDAGNAGTTEIINALNASLHYGNFAGLGVKLIWTLFGTLLSGLVCSGTVIWTKRTAQVTRTLISRPAPAALATESAS